MNPARLKKRMRELGWSYTRFADESGVSESTIKRVLGGSEPNASTAELMARALGSTVEWLNAEDDPDEPVMSSYSPSSTAEPPKNEPNEPTDTEDDKAMIAALQHVINNYKERIIDLKEAHADRVNSLTRDKLVLSIACGVLVAFLLAFFAYDILNPTVGWFQY
ncbi:MAG: helix-turn-helix transcriptional regulator [Clostridia bacterium]|nr:helix-turn-helix transcriptional regulator [Clostridia bacterium]